MINYKEGETSPFERKPHLCTRNGVEITCPVCGGNMFHERRTLMTSPIATFIRLQWLSEEADNLICDKCGYILWFKRTSGWLTLTQYVLIAVGILILVGVIR